jgi:hypothetical protein
MWWLDGMAISSYTQCYNSLVASVSSAFIAAPILFRLTPDGRRLRVLELEPVRRAAGAIARAQALRDDTLAAKRAGVLENRQHAIVRQVLVEA